MNTVAIFVANTSQVSNLLYLALSVSDLFTMVSLPKLSNCGACISLKTGTLIIGALNLVGSVICIIASIGTMAMAGYQVGAFDIISRKNQKTKWVGGSAEENGNFPFFVKFLPFPGIGGWDGAVAGPEYA